jgi:hypothetical protein
MATKYYCDRCSKEISEEGNGIHETLHQTLDKTPPFRMHIHFLKQFNEGKVDLCKECVIALLIQKAEERQTTRVFSYNYARPVSGVSGAGKESEK